MNESVDLTLLNDDVLDDLSRQDKSTFTRLESIDLNVRVYQRLDDLPPEYDQFFARMAKQSFFFSRAWFENLVQTTLEQNANLRLYAVETHQDNLTPQALLIMQTPAGQNGSRFQNWWARNSSMAGFTNFQSHTHTLLLPESTPNATEVLRKLIAAINEQRPSLIDLNLFSSTSAKLSMLVWALNDAGLTTSTYEYAGNWFEDTSHLDYSQYLKNRSKSIRKGCRRKLRRLQEKHQVRFETITHKQDAQRAIDLFYSVYDKSWKEQDYFKEFTPGLIRRCAAEGVLRLGVMYVDDEAVAVEMCIINNEQAVFAKSAYDPKFADYSISSILLLHVIKHVIENDHTTQISFGVFDDPYKKSWCNQRRELWGVVAFNTKSFWGLCGWTFHTLNQNIEYIKRLLKSTLRK